MKLIKFLDSKTTTLLSDSLNQTVLENLVISEHSISELSSKLNIPTLKLWRRMQKLLKANLVELSKTEKVGNIEKKLYRATATRFIPQQYFEFKPKDTNLQGAFKIYSEIQKEMLAKILAIHEVPKNADPVDFALFATMQAFAQVCGEPTAQARLMNLEQKLAEFNLKSSFLEK
jgi:hypothetical protein